MDSDSSDDNTDNSRLCNTINVIKFEGRSFVPFGQGICLFVFAIIYYLQNFCLKTASLAVFDCRNAYINKVRKMRELCCLMNITLHPAPPGIPLSEI